MFKWYYNLYIGRKAERYARKVRARLDAGKTDVGHYVITLASNPGDMLDIVNTIYLTQETLARRTPMIIGIAGDRDEAVKIAAGIIDESLESTGSPDARRYLEDLEAAYEKENGV